jgi:organic radical activating enzyme
MSTPLVVVTGGEPALQHDGLFHLVQTLRAAGRRVEIETNGTVPLGAVSRELDLVVVSPKLANSEIAFRHRHRAHVLRDLAGLEQAVFKFVVSSVEDLGEVAVLALDLNLRPDQVWIMPEGTDAERLAGRMRELASPVAERGWSLSHRLQTLLWGAERGH